jgi:hypothetical protein
MVLIEGTHIGLELVRRGSKEALRLVEFDGAGTFKGLWEFDSREEARAPNGFARTLCEYLARLGLGEALAHPLSRGIAVNAVGGPRLLAEFDQRRFFRIRKETDALRAAARHFDILRETCIAREWWHGTKTCWALLPPAYDFQHISAVVDVVELPMIRAGQSAFLQLSHFEDRFLGVEIWKPEALVTLDRAPVYDLETDTIPGLDVMVLPGGRLNRGYDGGEHRLVRALLPALPNNHEPFRWSIAIERAMRWLSMPDA